MDRKQDPLPITELLAAVEGGETNAQQELFAAVHSELRRIAGRQMAAERAGHTLQPTALVNEAYLRVFGSRTPEFERRGHFFCAAANAMHQILVDHARKKDSLKRGGGQKRVPLGEELVPYEQNPDLVLAIDMALKKLRDLDPRKAELVTMRFFGGFKIKDCADSLGISLRAAHEDWRIAKAWLRRELADGDLDALGVGKG